MAAFHGSTRVEDVSLTAASTKTVLQILAGSSQRVKLIAWGVSFDGVSVTEKPVKVVLKRSSTAGTSSAGTVVKKDDSIADGLRTTSRITFTGEPTAGDELEAKFIHPQTMYERGYADGKEHIIGGGDRIGIEVTTPTAGFAGNCSAFIEFEE